MFGYGLYGCGGGLFIIPLLIIGLILFGIYKIEENRNRKKNQTKYAMDLLAQRYVQGEISDEEYQKMKNNLK